MFFVIPEMPSKTFDMVLKKLPDHFNLNPETWFLIQRGALHIRAVSRSFRSGTPNGKPNLRPCVYLPALTDILLRRDFTKGRRPHLAQNIFLRTRFIFRPRLTGWNRLRKSSPEIRVSDPNPGVLVGYGPGFQNMVGSGSGFQKLVGSGPGFQDLVGFGSGLHNKV